MIMRIEAYTKVRTAYNTQRTGETQKENKVNARDQLQISNAGKDIQFAKKASIEVPDIREELVGPIKEKMDNGSYEVDNDSFASKLLEQYNSED